jgi:hypothetical protein
MRLPKLRFTLRLMMVAVAVVALILTIEALRRRSFAFEREAEKCKAQAFTYRAMAQKLERVSARLHEPKLAQDAQLKWQVVAYFERMERKYQRAAERPWLSVEMETAPDDDAD